ncbi:MAG: FtsX-like permease family protein [Gemmatimonadetes bacterium]|nr:FtsX-like permease family protein [Gemmatimonadota bacterium]
MVDALVWDAAAESPPTGVRPESSSTIVGVVRDFEHPGMPMARQAEIYAPLGVSTQFVNLLVRFDGDAEVVRQQIRRTIWTIDPDLPIPVVRTAREMLAASLGMTRFYTLLLGLFAGLAILLTSVGIYGVMAYSVARRTREMGIRIALGADRTRVAAVILREGMAVVAAGLIVGLLLARAGSRIMESLLFEVEPTDPLTYGVVALVVSIAAAAAVWVPARRATRADPIEVLRAD